MGDGYDTQVGKAALRRLLLAAADLVRQGLLAAPSVLILDEATCCLTCQVSESSSGPPNGAGRTDSRDHRPPVVDGADRRRVLVLDHGQVIEDGRLPNCRQRRRVIRSASELA